MSRDLSRFAQSRSRAPLRQSVFHGHARGSHASAQSQLTGCHHHRRPATGPAAPRHPAAPAPDRAHRHAHRLPRSAHTAFPAARYSCQTAGAVPDRRSAIGHGTLLSPPAASGRPCAPTARWSPPLFPSSPPRSRSRGSARHRPAPACPGFPATPHPHRLRDFPTAACAFSACHPVPAPRHR